MRIQSSRVNGNVLDRVQAGEIVTVTVHKRPRALLVRFPLSAADAEHICARIHDIYATVEIAEK